MMVAFTAEIERFGKMGEKTGWYYLYVSAEMASQLKPGCRKSFRIKGTLDNTAIQGIALTPMGEGNFIMSLKASLRKELGKNEGDPVNLSIEEDTTFTVEMPEDLELCLTEDPQCMENFLKLPKSHQNYYINWLNTAKTETTRTKRLVQIFAAMEKQMDFPEMIRSNKA